MQFRQAEQQYEKIFYVPISQLWTLSIETLHKRWNIDGKSTRIHQCPTDRKITLESVWNSRKPNKILDKLDLLIITVMICWRWFVDNRLITTRITSSISLLHLFILASNTYLSFSAKSTAFIWGTRIHFIPQI